MTNGKQEATFQGLSHCGQEPTDALLLLQVCSHKPHNIHILVSPDSESGSLTDRSEAALGIRALCVATLLGAVI